MSAHLTLPSPPTVCGCSLLEPTAATPGNNGTYSRPPTTLGLSYKQRIFYSTNNTPLRDLGDLLFFNRYRGVQPYTVELHRNAGK